MDTLIDLLSRSSSAALALDVAGKSTLVLAAAGVATLLLRRAAAATRHLAWCLALCGTLALPILALAVPGWAWPIVPARGDRAPSPAGGSAAARAAGLAGQRLPVAFVPDAGIAARAVGVGAFEATGPLPPRLRCRVESRRFRHRAGRWPSGRSWRARS